MGEAHRKWRWWLGCLWLGWVTLGPNCRSTSPATLCINPSLPSCLQVMAMPLEFSSNPTFTPFTLLIYAHGLFPAAWLQCRVAPLKGGRGIKTLFYDYWFLLITHLRVIWKEKRRDRRCVLRAVETEAQRALIQTWGKLWERRNVGMAECLGNGRATVENIWKTLKHSKEMKAEDHRWGDLSRRARS